MRIDETKDTVKSECVPQGIKDRVKTFHREKEANCIQHHRLIDTMALNRMAAAELDSLWRECKKFWQTKEPEIFVHARWNKSVAAPPRSARPTRGLKDPLGLITHALSRLNFSWVAFRFAINLDGTARYQRLDVSNVFLWCLQLCSRSKLFCRCGGLTDRSRGASTARL